MKGLRKYLTPFAPDQSGAAAVLYDLGGIIVICDAGGCAGNICGFDIREWQNKKSAICSAGLRDMDAIMGRDARLAQKISDAASYIDANFIAVIGTPVPAVIGTDYNALSNMIKKKTSLPVIYTDTNGMELYDRGEEKALLALYKQFAKDGLDVIPGKINLIGDCLDRVSCMVKNAANAAKREGGRADASGRCPGDDMDSYYDQPQGDPLEDIRMAGSAQLNIVLSPSGIKAARYLKDRFSTPYEIRFPLAGCVLPDMDYSGKNILVVHQHVFADSLRNELLLRGAKKVAAATWFMFADELRKEDDCFLKEEDDFAALCGAGGFDMIIADKTMRPILKDFNGCWIDMPHFGLSGR